MITKSGVACTTGDMCTDVRIVTATIIKVGISLCMCVYIYVGHCVKNAWYNVLECFPIVSNVVCGKCVPTQV